MMVPSALGDDRKEFIAIRAPSPALLRALDVYAAALISWNTRFNLIGPGTLDVIWTRHFLDSLQIYDRRPHAHSWIDLGSGAGFPGLIIAMIAHAEDRSTRVELIESNAKKISFLEYVSRETSTPITLHHARIESVLPTLAKKNIPEIISARAVAPLAQLVEWCAPLLKKGTRALFHKGKALDKEIKEASIRWRMRYAILPSVSAADSAIFELIDASLKKPRLR